MKTKRLLASIALFLSFGVFSLSASPLILGKDGASDYRIIIPESYPLPAIEKAVQTSAELLQRTFASNAIPIEIISEAEANQVTHGIYVGQTEFARANGVDFAGLEGWTCIFRVVGNDLIIVGNDRPDPIPLEKRRKREASLGGMPWLGTLKATTEFCYRYMGVRFMIPKWYGIEFLPQESLSVPANLDLRWRPAAADIEISRGKDLYSIAVGLEPSPKIISNYGHYHGSAIKPGTHGESNPEYFIYQGGRRENRGVHLCFSNPEVREVIYRKILEDCDTGYDIIELGQNDGYRPCQCEDCFNLYGVQPTTKPKDGLEYLRDSAWGEKIWHMHHEMAERLLKDRPGKKLMLCAYSISRKPPATITALPDNVLVEMMHPSADIFEEWKSVRVPSGFGAYLYTWGSLTPKNSMRAIKEQVEVLLNNDVRLIQINLKPRAYGLDGVTAYIFKRMLNDPDYASAEELFDEYMEGSYRQAAGFMRRFFQKLHERLYYEPEISRMSDRGRQPLLPFSALYSAELINELETLLKRAESVELGESASLRLATTRMEFDYLRHILKTLAVYQASMLSPEAVPLSQVLEVVEERNAWIDSLKKPRLAFTYHSAASLKTPRRWPSLNVPPFNWDTVQKRKDLASGITIEKEMPRLNVQRVNKPPTIDDAAWQAVPRHALNALEGRTEPLKAETSIQLLYDKDAVYLRFEAGLPRNLMDTFHPRGRDEELWLQESINLLLAPGGDKSQYYYLTYEPVANSWIDAAHGFITDPLDPKFGWNDQTWDADWNYANKMIPEKDLWISMATVPFASLAVETPRKGEVWCANFARIHYLKPVTDASHAGRVANRETSSWTGFLSGSHNPGEASMGDVVFE